MPQTRLRNRNNVVSRFAETRLWAGRTGYRITAKQEIFLFSKGPAETPLLRPTQPHFPWLPEFFLGGNAAGKCIRSLSANVMNKWSYASNPPYAFMA
jgi:hypothetical protein